MMQFIVIEDEILIKATNEEFEDAVKNIENIKSHWKPERRYFFYNLVCYIKNARKKLYLVN